MEDEEARAIWANSMAMLAKAEGHLRQLDPKRAGSDLAIVELYRAESKLMEADAVRMSFASKPLRFCEWRSQPLTDVSFSFPIAANDQLRTIFEASDSSEFLGVMRRVSALIDDAFRFLSRAEQILVFRRRNVWWTTWFFERKLKAICMACWARAFIKGAPIPFMGIESAPRSSSSVVDELLKNAMRMIRQDVYRLAGIVDVYGECAIVLKIASYLHEPGGIVALRDRERYMSSRLREAREVLAGQSEGKKIGTDIELYVSLINKKAVGRELCLVEC